MFAISLIINHENLAMSQWNHVAFILKMVGDWMDRNGILVSWCFSMALDVWFNDYGISLHQKILSRMPVSDQPWVTAVADLMSLLTWRRRTYWTSSCYHFRGKNICYYDAKLPSQFWSLFKLTICELMTEKCSFMISGMFVKKNN